MRNIILITVSSIKNNLKTKTLTLVFLCVTLMIAAGLATFFCLLLLKPAINAAVIDRPQIELYLSLILYTTCLICLGINMNVFAFQSITREKSSGNIESLLATPLNPKEIWVGKSLSVFIPGMVLGEIITFAALMAVNFIYIVPRAGFVFTRWIGLNSFVAVPLIYFCLSFLVHLIGLTGKPATGNIIVQVFLPVVLSLMINLMLRNILDVTSWSFTIANLSIAAVIAIIAIILKPRITRERIVLSN